MYFYALLFFIIAGVSAFIGFNELAPNLTAIGRLIFYAFLIMGCAILIFGHSRR